MKKRTKKASRKNKRRKRLGCIYLICWILIPLATLTFIVLDGLGLYPFNTERLLVLGACILVILIPFFTEITVKNVSIKKNNSTDDTK